MKEQITPKSQDYNKWYTDIITKAELADYGPVKGTMVIRPYGFEIWDRLKNSFDKRFKDTGHVNAYFPLFIPKSFLAKEAEHVEGFAKECAVVTHSRLKASEDGNDLIVDPESQLQEEIIVRPTSETVIWSMYKKWIHSYRDLPVLMNQWANVVRWEMRTRLFLRTSEFLWQEGHTAHETENEALEEAKKMLDIYKEVVEGQMGIPVLTGTKSESEKFAGAEETYCIEAMMGDKKALQAGTSHYLGQNFSKAFDVRFQTKDNKEDFVYATSWGVSTRLIGALIMVHGDDKGLRLPPNIAPIQVVVIPVINKKYNEEQFISYTESLISDFQAKGIRYYIDKREQYSVGYKFNEWEMKGVPLRLEVGPRDIENNQLVIARRDNNEKESISIKEASQNIEKKLIDIQNNLFSQAKEFMDKNTFTVSDYEEFKNQISLGGFINCGWDGSIDTENKIKEETKATIRCILFEQNISNIKCIYSGKPAKFQVIFSKAY
tara:strand:+ start:1217 stop:2689 length:1473 start_codon:yes stop_codon:yes gene_type:complete